MIRKLGLLAVVCCVFVLTGAESAQDFKIRQQCENDVIKAVLLVLKEKNPTLFLPTVSEVVAKVKELKQ